MEIGYNEAAVKEMTKEQFLEQMQHHAEDTDLSADYDRIAGKKEKAEKKAEKKN
jgi:hypothetical protein